MRCNNCGYPNKANTLKCERCNYNMRGSLNKAGSDNQKQEQLNPENEPAATIVAPPSKLTAHDKGVLKKGPSSREAVSPSVNPKISGGTVPLHFDVKKAGRRIRLQRLDEQGQLEEFEITMSNNETKELNRSNLDEDNNTITSKVQAVITTDENGKLFIENKSDYQSTCLLIQNKMELNDGDKVMLGNRVFLVKKEHGSIDNSKKTKPLN